MAMRKLSLAGLFVSLGLVLPIGFHSLGLGSSFLPMHIPVLLAGIYLGWRFGALVGVVTPLLSAVLTGMPPLTVAFMMVVELPLYAVTVSILYRWSKNALVSVAGTALVGRLVYGLTGYLLFPLLGLPPVSPLYPVTAGIVSGLPGVALQLVAVPLLVGRFKPERNV